MASLSLSVWRPLQMVRPLMYTSESEGISNSPFIRDELYEQIYVWSPEEDLWGAIEDETRRTQLKEAFVQTFQANLLPAARGLDKLSEFIRALEQAIIQEQTINWMPSLQTAQNDENEHFALAVVPHLALLNHLIWIYEMWRHTPSIALVVR